MGKIDSREIGEVDSHTDSGSSLLLIKYATESQSICFQLQRGEAAQEWEEALYHIICLSTAFPWGLPRYFHFFSPLHCLLLRVLKVISQGHGASSAQSLLSLVYKLKWNCFVI